MILRELFESVTQIWAKQGNKTVRKYRCTSGRRKGRVVARPSTCSAPLNTTSSKNIQQTKHKRAGMIKHKTARTKTYKPTSRRVARLNKPAKRTIRSTRRKKI